MDGWPNRHRLSQETLRSSESAYRSGVRVRSLVCHKKDSLLTLGLAGLNGQYRAGSAQIVPDELAAHSTALDCKGFSLLEPADW